jgi:hypothetical protein
MGISWLIIFLFIIPIPTSVFAQQLCSPPKPLPSGQDDLGMREEEFSISNANGSLHWLEKDSWGVIRKHTTTEELLGDTEQFGIPFINSVSTVKGVLLRQQALLEKQQLEIEKMKLKERSGSQAGVSEAQRRFDEAKKEFCNFLKKAKFVA